MLGIIRTDNLTSEDRRRTMQRVHSKDTVPELIVRRLAHKMGYRYRLHRSDLPGKPDLVFSKRRKVIFINGCFWHGHTCKAGQKRPKTNKDYWVTKLERNRERDIENCQELETRGWRVLVIWECEVKDKVGLQRKLVDFLGDARSV